MKIGILTYYRTGNFGANLQAVSTYNYLKNQGHEVVFLHYLSRYTNYVETKSEKVNRQLAEHYRFVDENLPNQSGKIYNAKELGRIIERERIDGILIGSDAVLQHFPLFSTLRWGQGLKSWLRPIQGERRFPNIFWGVGFSDRIPTAMISVSSQNSPYLKWCGFTKKCMARCLESMRFVSVRDEWTKKLVNSVCPAITPEITPDPVFAFNQNAGQLVPTKEEVCKKFGLAKNYALVGLRGNYLPEDTLKAIELRFHQRGVQCVAFPVLTPSPLSYGKKIELPLSPIDWYALIKYATAYIGNNMHPIVISLHNAVPCFSIDNWGTTNFWGKRIDDGSSKVQDILDRYGLSDNRSVITDGHCSATADEIFDALDSYDRQRVAEISARQYGRYDEMMRNCLNKLARKK